MTHIPDSPAPSRAGEDVTAEHVEISQGGASNVNATTVTLNQGGAARVQATDVTVNQGGIALARAERVSLRDGSGALAVLAGEASLGAGSNVVLLFARSVRGDIRPVLDWRSAAACGAAAGLVLAILRRR